MFPAPIDDYLRPTTVAEALAALAPYDAGDAMFIAGGQSLMQAIKSRMARPRALVDLQAIDELRGICPDGRSLVVGAMTRYVTIAGDERLGGWFAALRDAAAHVGDRQVRNRGTLGGSCCWNYVASCTPAVVMGLGGEMQLASTRGTRSVGAGDFLIAPLETARKDDEILLAVRFTAPAGAGGSAYRKWGLVKDALPVVGVCVAVALDAQGRCSEARITLSGLAAGAQRAPAGEALLVGSTGDDASIDQAFAAIADSVDAQSDKWASTAYRQQLIRSLGSEVAHTAFARAKGAQ